MREVDWGVYVEENFPFNLQNLMWDTTKEHFIWPLQQTKNPHSPWPWRLAPCQHRPSAFSIGDSCPYGFHCLRHDTDRTFLRSDKVRRIAESLGPTEVRDKLHEHEIGWTWMIWQVLVERVFLLAVSFLHSTKITSNAVDYLGGGHYSSVCNMTVEAQNQAKRQVAIQCNIVRLFEVINSQHVSKTRSIWRCFAMSLESPIVYWDWY